MHLEEMFRLIEQNRRKFIAKWAAKAPNDQSEAVLTEAEVTAGK